MKVNYIIKDNISVFDLQSLILRHNDYIELK